MTAPPKHSGPGRSKEIDLQPTANTSYAKTSVADDKSNLIRGHENPSQLKGLTLAIPTVMADLRQADWFGGILGDTPECFISEA